MALGYRVVHVLATPLEGLPKIGLVRVALWGRPREPVGDVGEGAGSLLMREPEFASLAAGRVPVVVFVVPAVMRVFWCGSVSRRGWV